MPIDPITKKVNVIVHRAFGADYRGDWEVVGVRGESSLTRALNRHRIILDRTEFADVVAGFPFYAPAFIFEPRIVAKISRDGSRMIVSDRYPINVKVYLEEYRKAFEKDPKITSYSTAFFLECIRSGGNNKL